MYDPFVATCKTFPIEKRFYEKFSTTHVSIISPPASHFPSNMKFF
jgi:hypothetical protein